MGIYDREYYRSEGPSFLGSFTDQGKACKWLIGINIAFFVASLFTQPAHPGPRFVVDDRGNPVRVDRDDAPPRFGDRDGFVHEALALEPEAVLHGQVWRLLTYAFLHQGIWHILWNMLFLWWFGHEMEELYGAREFLIFYLVSAFLGGVAFTAWAFSRPDGMLWSCVGASGAVTAVMVLYAFHYPSRIIRLWWFLPVPIWLFVLFQVGQDVFTWATNAPTQTAVTVHLAGAAFGFGYYKRNWRLAPLWQAVTRFRLPQRRPRVRIYDEEEPVARRPRPAAAPAATGITTSPAPSPSADEHLEAQVDAVLEKVARSGRDSLTDSEKALLVRASEVYKRKQR
jgi:membrane associated rhomboid family serine protease